MITSEKVLVLARGYVELSDEERQEFVRLIAPTGDSEASEEWIAELHKRADDIDGGRVNLIDGDDFLGRLRAV